MSIVENVSPTSSVGAASSPTADSYHVIRQSVSLITRYVNGLDPPLVNVRTADARCRPVAHASMRFGPAFESVVWKCRSWKLALPVPAPPPVAPDDAFVTPQASERTSISP